MTNRRVPTLLTFVIVPTLLFASTACTSGSDHDDNPKPKPTGSAPASSFKPEDLAVLNNIDPCRLGEDAIDKVRLNGRTWDKAHLTYPVHIEPVEINGERRCEYDNGLLAVSTYVEKDGSDWLFKALQQGRGGSNSDHPFTGDLKRHAEGGWFTYRGETVGFAMKIKGTGVIVVVRTPASSAYQRKDLNAIAMESLVDVNFAEDEPREYTEHDPESGLEDTRWGTIRWFDPAPSPKPSSTSSPSTPASPASSPSASASKQ